MALYRSWSITQPQVVDLIRGHASQAGGVRALARQWRCSEAYISLILSGRRSPGRLVLKRLGLRKLAQPLLYATEKGSK